jgi:hypothetical protein
LQGERGEDEGEEEGTVEAKREEGAKCSDMGIALEADDRDAAAE